MKIGVISDTHARELNDLPRKLVETLSGVDMIVHAGDYTHKSLLDELKSLGTFRGVYGNTDPPEIRVELPAVNLFEVEGFKIGVTHPAKGGSPVGMEERIRNKFNEIDIIIYGHSHKPNNETINKITYFNPGSPTNASRVPFKSYGILEIGTRINGQIHKL